MSRIYNLSPPWRLNGGSGTALLFNFQDKLCNISYLPHAAILHCFITAPNVNVRAFSSIISVFI
jgi:hypothetical protein